MRQVDEIGKRLAMPVRGFPWLGPVLKSHRQHFIEFCGWDGEIYVKDRGILSFTEYYRYILKQGFCLMIDGVIVGPVFISVHYNTLHKEYLRQLKEDQLKQESQKEGIIIAGKEAVFESAVELYRRGIFDENMIKARIWRYVKPEHRERVFSELKNKGA
ncbi:hypothetical protein [Caldibacillus debilis]|uniref:Uncharacterized protein n=1 Tax=Caldibacillus debilis GB1 TaxID=1339248 RepID=A0A420VE80_9BACI|nr:hypothetical protein [Caldibacillus debilis]RKO61866.1 hypothetical protein Cdeb_01361 [Caldibacillus debilis GB1]